MKKFEKLLEEEVEKKSKEYRNPIKRETFVKLVNDDNLKINKRLDKNRIDAFERIWNTAMTLTRRRYGFGRNDTNLKFSEITSMFAKENTYYKSSILENFENSDGKGIIEKFNDAERKTYEERTDNFLRKYGDEKVYSDEDKTLNDYFDDYKKGKISKEKMNFIIADFEEGNQEYLSQDYHGKNYESALSIINEQFEE